MAFNNLKSEKRLFTIADRQQGFFTTQLAIQAGFQDALHPYHIKQGHWKREMRGIYRLVLYPQSMMARYIILSLWSRNREGVPQGVLSHETALSIHDLSDANPAKIHMTVPKTFRRYSAIPKVLLLHFGPTYDEADIQERRGFSVTRPARTVRDMLADDSADLEKIEQALRDGYRTGRIPIKEQKTLLHDFPHAKHLFPSSIRKGV